MRIRLVAITTQLPLVLYYRILLPPSIKTLLYIGIIKFIGLGNFWVNALHQFQSYLDTRRQSIYANNLPPSC